MINLNKHYTYAKTRQGRRKRAKKWPMSIKVHSWSVNGDVDVDVAWNANMVSSLGFNTNVAWRNVIVLTREGYVAQSDMYYKIQTHPLMMECFHLHDFPFGTIHGANDCILTQHIRGCKGTYTHHSYTDQCGLVLICFS